LKYFLSRYSFPLAFRYSVLKIKRGATKNEVSAAFRKEMLKHHPDTQSSASEAEKARAVERAKHISEAYRNIKAEMKR
jgi:DnaJ-class molecular chaperone